MTDADLTFDAEVRRAASDLWLASRLVNDSVMRAALVALYAMQVELSKVSGVAVNPLAGEIRLAWWREEVEALDIDGRIPGHPALRILKAAPGLDHAALHAMIEARHAELEPRPFADEAALAAYLDGVDGCLMRAALGLLAPGAAAELTYTARAWGWCRVLGEHPSWRAKGRDWTPLAWGQASDEDIAAHVRHKVADALDAAKAEVVALTVPAFPAVAYVALAKTYAYGRAPSDLEKRARLLWAALRGRF